MLETFFRSVGGLPARLIRPRIGLFLLAAILAAPAVAQSSFITQVVAGAAHSCALDSSGQVWCWGGNAAGQLGDGTTTGRFLPFPVRGITDATHIAAGSSHTCARRSNGSVLCWGLNEFGQLGDGTTTNRSSPVPVRALADVTWLALGLDHSCARRATGRVDCWGRNDWGQLGNGSTADSVTPVSVAGLTDATMIASDSRHNCARRATGGVVCWGRNFFGELGDNTTTVRRTPVAVLSLSDALQVTTGSGTSCAARTSRRVACWGWNGYGQLGTGDTSDRRRPAEVALLTDAMQVEGGGTHACARRSDGRVMCWGDNGRGQLGLGTFVSRTTPAVLPRLDGVTQIATGWNHSCALRGTQGVVCWGYNNAGQLGNGTTVNSPNPLAVRFPTQTGLSGPETGVFGQDLEFSAIVASRGGTPRGFVSFERNGSVFASPALDASGRTTASTTLPVGTHQIRVRYDGFTGFRPSSSEPLTVTIARAVTQTALTGPDDGDFGDPLGFTATVTSAGGTASGTVSFRRDGVEFATGALDDAGRATANGSFPVGAHQIRAVYLGDGSFTGSTSAPHPVTVTADTTTALSGPTTGIAFDRLTYVANVISAAGIPGGQVRFRRNGEVFATADLDAAGRASVDAQFAAGVGRITARYVGSEFHRPSVSEAVVVEIAPRPTTTGLTGPSAGTAGEELSFTAQVGFPAPDGADTAATAIDPPMVSFRRDGVEFARAEVLSANSATARGRFWAGTHRITAHFLGTADFEPSDSAPVTLTVPALNRHFSGGGAVFGQTAGCGPALAGHPHPVTIHYSPSELNGLPSGVSIVWREGAEHLALWGEMAPSGSFFGGAGRGSWTRFIFYPTRPLIRVVVRQVTQPADGSLTAATEMMLRLRVQNFAAIPGCAVTVAGMLRRE